MTDSLQEFVCEDYKPAVTDTGNDIHSDASTVDEPINEEDVAQEDAYAYLQGLNQCNDNFGMRKRAPKRKTSNIWAHYIQQQGSRAKCKYCRSCLSTTGGSQGNLHRHMRTKHASIFLKPERKSLLLQQDIEEPATLDAATVLASPALSIGRDEQIDNQVIKMLAKGHHSLRVVEEPEFRNLLTQISHCSGYELPTRQVISKTLLPKIYENSVLQLKQKLSTVEAVCLTIDSWESQDGQSYIAVTAHFINLFTTLCSGLISCKSYDKTNASENIYTFLNKVINDWQLTNKVVAIVTDNNLNIITAVAKGEWTKIECFAHCLNLVVQGALDKIATTIQKVRLQIPENYEKDDPKRWNSTYDMLTRFVEIKEAGITKFLQKDKVIFIEEILQILEPFYDITLEISEEKDISLSKILMYAKLLQSFLCERRPSNDAVSEFLKSLLEGIQKQFDLLECNFLYAECAILDPRFKKRGFKNEANYEMAVTQLSEKISAYDLPTDNTDDVVMTSNTIWSKYDNTYFQENGDEDKSVAARKELDKYINEEYLERTKDPLAWWEQHKVLYPRLYQIVLKRLCIVATSVPGNKIFDNNDHIINERKKLLKSDEMSDLVFLHHNM